MADVEIAPQCSHGMMCGVCSRIANEADLALWKAFAKRVTLKFPFSVGLRFDSRLDGTIVTAMFDVLDRDTSKPITIKTRKHCGSWRSDIHASETIFHVIECAFEHEICESVYIDGVRVREPHKDYE